MTTNMRAEWARLAAVRDELPDIFAPEELAGMPEPARRWLRHAIAPGTALARSVTLTMRGQIRIGAWRPFTARQVLTPPEGFVWTATARVAGLPVTGFDRWSADTGEMRWRLLGLVPVMSGTGADIGRSAAGRLAAEGISLLPTSFRRCRWAAGATPDTAVATWRVGEGDEHVELDVGPGGRLRGIRMRRWGNPAGEPFARYPFGAAFEAEQRFAGIVVPTRLRAGWWRGADRQADGEFFRAEITDATFH